jgi:hypothetical protein
MIKRHGVKHDESGPGARLFVENIDIIISTDWHGE